MAPKKRGDRSLRAGQNRKPENTLKKHALTPAMESRKWKPGQSGNPGGRPKKDLASEICEEIFAEHRDKIKAAIRRKLIKGDAKMFAVASDRAFGKPPQTVDVNGQIQTIVSIDL
jgi:hypothetical protein